MIFRNANLLDVEKIVHFVNRAYRGEEAKKGWTTEAYYLEGTRASNAMIVELLIEQPGLIILGFDSKSSEPLDQTATENLELRGLVYIKPSDATCYLGMLTVDPDFQDKGYGKLLMAKAEAVAKEIGSKKMEMKVITIRESLIQWYQRQGYKKTGRYAGFPAGEDYGQPKEDLSMEYLEREL
jgi:ribosomal protein S18 acetylase RimI-like enzyme